MARIALDEFSTADGCSLESSEDCRDPFDGQDPMMKL